VIDSADHATHRSGVVSAGNRISGCLGQVLCAVTICLESGGLPTYSAPNKESTFSETLISAVKSTFSPSNHHKSIKELLWRSFLKICFSPYITHREATEVQKQFLGKSSKFQQNEQYLRICMEL